MKVDYKFIKKVETNYKQPTNEGFVPMNGTRVIGQSGVTIGDGIDLGAHSKASLEQLGVKDEVIEVLEPYLGLQRKDAVKALAEAPLKLEDEVVKKLNDVFRKRDEELIEKHFGKDVINKLPVENQTVVFSLVRNFGPKAVKFYTTKCIVLGHIDEAIKCLRDTKQWKNRELDNRRNMEADLLEASKKAPKAAEEVVEEVVELEPEIELNEEELQND